MGPSNAKTHRLIPLACVNNIRTLRIDKNDTTDSYTPALPQLHSLLSKKVSKALGLSERILIPVNGELKAMSIKRAIPLVLDTGNASHITNSTDGTHHTTHRSIDPPIHPPIHRSTHRSIDPPIHPQYHWKT